MKKNHNLRSRAIKGTFWVALANILGRAITLISMPVLARLLSKADFGVFGIITTIAMISQVIVSFGFDLWYVKSSDKEKTRYAIFIKVSLLSIFILCIGLAFLAQPLSVFYKDPQLKTLMYWFALYFIIGGASQILRQQLAKHLEFKKTSLATIAKQITQAIVSIFIAIYFKNVYALLLGFIAGGIIEFIVLFTITAKPFFEGLSHFFSIDIFHAFKKNGTFTISTMSSQLINTAARYISTPIFGRTSGLSATGLFVTMDSLITQPLNIIIGSISTTSLSVLAKVPNNNLANISLRISRLLLVISAPVFAFLWLYSEETINIFLGAKWVDGANVLRLLMLPAFFNIVVSPISQLFIILNKPQRLLVWNIIFFTSNVVAIILGSHFGFYFAVLCYAIVGVIMRLTLQIMTSQLLSISIWSFIKLYFEFMPIWIPLILPGIVIKLYFDHIWAIFIYAVCGLLMYFYLIKKYRPRVHSEIKTIYHTIKPDKFSFIKDRNDQQI